MFAAALLLPTLILTALAAIISSIRGRRRRQATREAGDRLAVAAPTQAVKPCT
jgi:hypothetical protein